MCYASGPLPAKSSSLDEWCPGKPDRTGAVQATDEDEIMRSLSQLDDVRNELEAADEREKLMRQQLREAENALISAKADAQRLKASSNGHDQRKGELESALAQV